MRKKIDGKQYDDPPYSTIDERLTLYEDYEKFIENKKYRNAWGKRIKCSKEQLEEVLKLQAEWDNSSGKKYEALVKRKHSLDDMRMFFEEAEPLYKKLMTAYGIRVCAAKGCWIEIPEGSNLRQKYHSKACSQRERDRKSCEKNPETKKLSNIKSYTKIGLEKAGINDNEIKRKIIEKINRGMAED